MEQDLATKLASVLNCETRVVLQLDKNYTSKGLNTEEIAAILRPILEEYTNKTK